MKTKQEIAKELSTLCDFTGDARLYELSKPLDGHRYVVVSATYSPFSGPETYIFPADEHGKVTSWLELEGSYRGDLDHARALKNAGYELSMTSQ